MTGVVRKSVENNESFQSAINYQIPGIGVRPKSIAEDTTFFFFAKDILSPPRGPDQFSPHDI
jgi:hypothetical protein